jgi:photosystem II stability/assembly factor-like uncharacterized protein
VERQSGTEADLHSVASHGTDIVAVGDHATILLSTDNGESWSIKHSGYRVYMPAVVINASQIIAGGRDNQTGDALIIRSMDRGEKRRLSI